MPQLFLVQKTKQGTLGPLIYEADGTCSLFGHTIFPHMSASSVFPDARLMKQADGPLNVEVLDEGRTVRTDVLRWVQAEASWYCYSTDPASHRNPPPAGSELETLLGTRRVYQDGPQSGGRLFTRAAFQKGEISMDSRTASARPRPVPQQPARVTAPQAPAGQTSPAARESDRKPPAATPKKGSRKIACVVMTLLVIAVAGVFLARVLHAQVPSAGAGDGADRRGDP